MVVSHYFLWHYSIALVRFTSIYRDLVFFVADFFSLPILLKSFLAPWRRLSEPYPEDKFNISEILAVFVVNSLMRLVGIIMRAFIIVIGLVALVVIIILYPVLLVLWLALPLAIVILLAAGFRLLFF